MSHRQKHHSARLLAMAALLSMAPIQGAWAQTAPELGTASYFAVLGGTNVTCTTSSVVGDVGVSPGSAVPFTNTGCTITGRTPPATNAAAVDARTAFLKAYAKLRLQSASCSQLPGNLADQNLAPGVYCVDAVAKAGNLTLTGPSKGVWIFLVNGALTGTNFSVTMAGGGQPYNVFWAPSAAATMTTSVFQGNILAGDAIDGSITLTGGTLTGRALANVAMTMTDTKVINSGPLSASPNPKGECNHRNGKHQRNHDDDKHKSHDDDKHESHHEDKHQ